MDDIFDLLGLEDSDWEVGSFGDTFVCPCGNEIELDGKCPEGCVSPMRSMGFI